MPQYATVSDYYAFIGEVQPDPLSDADSLKLNALLTQASDDIALALRFVRIPADGDGIPLITSQGVARKRATCAQVKSWIPEGGSFADADTSGAGWDAISLIGVQFSRRSGAGQTTETAAAKRISPQAMSILAAEFSGIQPVAHPGG